MTTHTPRRTIRMSDEEWAAGHAKARQRGETLRWAPLWAQFRRKENRER